MQFKYPSCASAPGNRYADAVLIDLSVARKRRTRGFTLVELMVVIAIIALLVSILLPSLQNAKKLVRRVTCASNVRNISVAVTQYHHEHKGWLPMCYQEWTSGESYVTGATYCREISKFLGCKDDPWFDGGFWESGAPTVLTCPSERKDFGRHILGYGWNWSYLGAYQMLGETWNLRRKINNVKRPSETSCLGESRPMENAETTIFWGHQGTAPDYYCSRRHNDGANYLCVDGHVEYAKYDYLIDDWLGDERTLWRGE